MRVVADLHLHSKYSRAVSPYMTLPVMAEFAKRKGLDLLSAADWTYPAWFAELREQLTESNEGIYRLKTDDSAVPTQFLLSTEISSMYKQGEKFRRIHNLVFVPDFSAAEKVTAALRERGANLTADGRPIIGLSSKHLLELILEIDERSLLIPCHIWTPHFGIYGSASGFDSLEEAFGELAPFVYGIETGISSDPLMNWQIPELTTRSILSFSDAHSAPKMGREATVMELEKVTYENVRQAIMRPSLLERDRKTKGDRGYKNEKEEISGTSVPSEPFVSQVSYTIEFYPEEGKYHYSGHRNCKISFGPEDIATKGTTCPVCGRKMTEGVMLRVQQLAKNGYAPTLQSDIDEAGMLWYTDPLKRQPPFVKLVPLLEIVAESMQMTVLSKKVQTMYESLFAHFSSELSILMDVPVSALEQVTGSSLAQNIAQVRRGAITIVPGYDGEYGVVQIREEGNEREAAQLKLL